MDLLGAETTTGESLGWLLALSEEDRVAVELMFRNLGAGLQIRVKNLEEVLEDQPDNKIAKAEYKRLSALLARTSQYVKDITPSE
jgi:hypothetical protein